MTTPGKDTIKSVLDGQATKKEAREVVEWFASTKEGQLYLSELINQNILQFEIEGLDENTCLPLLSEQILEEINRQIHRKRMRRTIFRVAAILLPFVMIVGFGMFANSRVDFFGTSEFADLYIPKGENSRIMFQDGSQAFLNSDTKIRYPLKFGLTSREVEIDGEAYFNVSKNSKRPFIIKLNNTRVKVLGTSFNVKAYNNDKFQSIVLDNGSVFFETPKNDYEMFPGQEALYDKTTGKCVINKLDNSSDASEWVNNVIFFKDTPIAEVLKTLNRAFNVEFKIIDPNVYKYTYTLTTEKTSLEKITKELEKITPLRFENECENVICVKLK